MFTTKSDGFGNRKISVNGQYLAMVKDLIRAGFGSACSVSTETQEA